jgi:hypothetical protein
MPHTGIYLFCAEHLPIIYNAQKTEAPQHRPCVRESVAGNGVEPMTTWLQVILAVGIINISVAASAFTFEVWDNYERRRAAYTVCEDYLRIDPREKISNEQWMQRRQCINMAMGYIAK